MKNKCLKCQEEFSYKERLRIQFKENSVLYKFYLYLFKSGRKNK